MNVLTIARREWASLFATPVGWLVVAGWLFVVGFFWWWAVQIYVIDSQDLVFNPYAAQSLNLTDFLLAPFFGNLTVVLVLLLPALSMRTIARERAQRTLELLFTSPVTTAEIVLGKYLGTVGMVAAMLALALPYPLTLYLWGSPEWGAIAGGFMGLGLIAAAMLALGMLFSSLTESQMVALILTFAAGLLLLLADGRGGDPDALGAQLSFTNHVSDLLRGAVRLSDVVYFVVFAAVFLFATHQRLESFRWS